MPTDFSPHLQAGLIQVVGHDGSGLPFSKGKLATGVLATGMETEAAYHIAALVEADLRAKSRTRIGIDELEALTRGVIEHHAGRGLAATYSAWQALHHSGRPIFIVLGGAPGVGKSTIATRLAVRLGITRVVTTDTVREILRTVIAESVLPELHVSTYEDTHAGVCDHDWRSTFSRQAHAVGEATLALVRRLATEGRNAIIEGVHLMPGRTARGLQGHSMRPLIAEALVTLTDERLHRAHLSARQEEEPGRDGSRHLRHFASIRAMQDLLLREAETQAVPCYDVAEPSDLTSQLVGRILADADAGAAADAPADAPAATVRR